MWMMYNTRTKCELGVIFDLWIQSIHIHSRHRTIGDTFKSRVHRIGRHQLLLHNTAYQSHRVDHDGVTFKASSIQRDVSS